MTAGTALGSLTQGFSYALVVLARASDRSDCVSKALEMGLLNNCTNMTHASNSSLYSCPAMGFSVPAGFAAWLDKDAPAKYAAWRALCEGETYPRIIEEEIYGSDSFNLYPESRQVPCLPVCTVRSNGSGNDSNASNDFNASNGSSTSDSACNDGSVQDADAVPTVFSYEFTRDPPRANGDCTETRWRRRWGATPAPKSEPMTVTLALILPGVLTCQSSGLAETSTRCCRRFTRSASKEKDCEREPSLMFTPNDSSVW